MPKARPRLRDPLPLIMFSMFLDVGVYGMIAPLLPLFVRDFGGNAALAGVIGAMYAAMQLLCGPALGALSDRFGRKPVLTTCLVGTAISYLALAAAPSLPMLVLAVILDGITGGNLSTAYAYVADISTAEDKAQRLAISGAAFGLGSMLGPAAGGMLAASGLHAPLFVAGVVALANALFCWLALPESLLPALRTLALNLPAFVNPLSALRGAREWAAVLSAIFLANLGFGGLQSNFPLFAQLRFAWTAREIGWFIAFVGVCAVLTQGVLLRIAQGQLRAGVLIVIGLSTLAIGLAGIGLAPEPHWLYAAAAVAALGSGLCLPTLSAWMSNQAGPMQQGAVMGATQTTIALANITAPLLAGAAFAYVAAPAPYLLGAALTLMALIASRQVRGDSP